MSEETLRRLVREGSGLLQAALVLQREPCDHEGIGQPGCGTCDPLLKHWLEWVRAALAAPGERLFPEMVRPNDWVDPKFAAPAAEQVYLPMDCPVCGRHRVEWDGQVLRCEKCATSSEWDGFTKERYALHSAIEAAPAAEGLDVQQFDDILKGLSDG